MIQSQDLLSRLGIPYNDCYSQADIDAKAQGIIAAYFAKENGTYKTPGLADGDPSVLITPDWAKLSQRSAALIAMQAAVRVGDLATAHAKLDQANQLGNQTGMPIVSCELSDLQVLCNGHGWGAEMAKAVEQGMLLADMTAAKAIIEPAIAETPRPPAPQPAVPAYIDLPGPLPGYAIGQIVPFPDGSKWAYCSLPFGWPSGITYRLVKVA